MPVTAGVARLGLALPLLCAAACGGGGSGGGDYVALQRVVGGDAERGRGAIRARGCASCHVVPGVRGSQAHVGPPLTAFARRAYIAGEVPNEPDRLVAWIMDPQQLRPGSAMPRLGIGEAEARDIAAYLFGLH